MTGDTPYNKLSEPGPIKGFKIWYIPESLEDCSKHMCECCEHNDELFGEICNYRIIHFMNKK